MDPKGEPKVSVHILAKETTGFGKLLMVAAVESIYKAGYADEIVIVDNGCAEEIIHAARLVIPPAVAIGGPKGIIECDVPHVHIIKNTETDSFADLRNLALDYTRERGVCNYFHWVDTDECYPPETFDKIKKAMAEHEPAAIMNYFIHFMINPTLWQETQNKIHIYKITPELRWELPVHEHVVGYDKDNIINTNMPYFHYGYIRPQWVQAIKWLRYDVWHHGHANGYREYFDEGWDKVVDYYTDGRTPDQCLEDRRTSVCKEYDGGHPEAFVKYILEPWQESGKPWEEWVNEAVSDDLWDRWKQKREELGSWKSTIAWACEEAGFPEKKDG